MRRKLSSLLLVGTMIAVATSARPLAAQNTPSLDVALTYNATLSNSTNSSHFWMQGGSVQLHGQFYRGLGVVAEVAGMHIGNINSSGVGLGLVTATFGPRYTWSPSHSRYSLFGQALLGEANGFNGVLPAAGGATDSSNSFAVQAGGGLNVKLSPRIALRACEANWLRTQLPNGTTNVQNFLRLGAGLVVRFK
jgi:hypothetical protein